MQRAIHIDRLIIEECRSISRAKLRREFTQSVVDSNPCGLFHTMGPSMIISIDWCEGGRAVNSHMKLMTPGS